ncbi:MAG: S41 family peptidase [Bacteroidales bacterium]|nr:S41 family peptidase [Bacteroidales bacterium]
MRKQSYIPLIAAVSVIIGMAIGFFVLKKPDNSSSFALNTAAGNKIGYILNIIDHDYVDKTDKDSLTDEAIRCLLTELDPHSVYLTKEQVKNENDDLKGNFDGIGIQFRIVDDTIAVVRTINGGPSEKAGILAGDRIVKVDGRKLKNITNDTVLHLLKGRKGSTVRLDIKRKGVDHLLGFTVKRDVIKTKAVAYYGMLDDITGYIKLEEFTANSHDEVASALRALNKQGMKQLVFDLRNNGGGYLDQAVAIADEFTAKGDLIVYTNGRLRGRSDSYATSGGLFEQGKLIVMINEMSASASEIVSGCIQDNDRGIIAGRRTFGKGLVQEQRMLADNSAVRITVARYYTPSGRCIQRPYIKGDPDKYFEDFITRFDDNMTDTVKHDEKLKYKTKKGRFVYGGGGIEPDITIPYTSLKRSEAFNSLFKNGLIYKYCFDYVDNNRNTFKQYSDGTDFLNRYNVSNDVYQKLISYAKTNGVQTGRLSASETEEIKQLMKGYIAQSLYDDAFFYKIYTKLDNELQTVRQKF